MIVTNGRRPAVKATAGGFEFAAGPDGIQRSVYRQPVAEQALGPPAVIVHCPETLYLTPAEARAFAQSMLTEADAVEAQS